MSKLTAFTQLCRLNSNYIHNYGALYKSQSNLKYSLNHFTIQSLYHNSSSRSHTNHHLIYNNLSKCKFGSLAKHPPSTSILEVLNNNNSNNPNASNQPIYESVAPRRPNFRHLMSQQFVPLLKDNPTQATSISHQLLIRAGLIRMTGGAGLYTILPLGNRVLNKIINIIDSELQAIGCNKLDFSLLMNSSLWEQTGRWQSTGQELFKLKDRKSANYVLGPTHEELVTSLVANEISSYKQLPLKLYNIGKKFRDEIRPRGGLLRAREFIMKDLYSFDASEDDALNTYDLVCSAYNNIFKQLNLPVIKVEADSGNIGGSLTHEYHIVAASGDDTIIKCNTCNYAANVEKAMGNIDESKLPLINEKISLSGHAQSLQTKFADSLLPMEFIRPDVQRKYELCLVKLTPQQKAADLYIVYLASNRTINEYAVKNHLGAAEIKLIPQNEHLKYMSEYINGTKKGIKPKILIDDTIVPYATDIDADMAIDKAMEDQEKLKQKKPEFDNEIESALNIDKQTILDENGQVSFEKLSEQIEMKLETEAGQKLLKKLQEKLGVDKQTGDINFKNIIEEQLAKERAKQEAAMAANQTDKNMPPNTDFFDPELAGEINTLIVNNTIQGSFRFTEPGDFCTTLKCKGQLTSVKGIEVGHVFYLSDKYSKSLQASIINSKGKNQLIEMGCYGLGVSRILAATIEASNDTNGIVWPVSMAPYKAIIIPTIQPKPAEKMKLNTPSGVPIDTTNHVDNITIAESIYDELQSDYLTRDDILIDDRVTDMQLGVRIKQAQLLGIPLIIIVGKSLQEQGVVEIELRHSNEKKYVKQNEIINIIRELYNNPPKLNAVNTQPLFRGQTKNKHN